MSRLCSLAAVIVVTTGITAIAPAADPLEYFPSDTHVVIRLKNPGDALSKVATLLDEIQPGMSSFLDQYKTLIRERAIDSTQSLYVGADLSGGYPMNVFSIPTTNADQLTATWPEGRHKVVGNRVLLTNIETGVPDAADPDATVLSVLKGETRQVFDRGDLSVFVNVEQLKSDFQDELEFARETTDAMLEGVGKAMSQTNGVNLQGIMDMYRTLNRGMYQGLEDAETYTLAVNVDQQGLGTEQYTAFADGSVTSTALSMHPTSPITTLARLPADAVGYFALNGDMQKFMQWSMSLSASMLSESPEQKQQLESAMQAWQQVDFGELAGEFRLGSSTDGVLQYSAVAQAKPIAKVRESMRKVSRLMGSIEAYGMKQEMTLDPDGETIGSQKVDVMTIKQEFPPNLDPTGMQQKMQQMLFGPGGIVSRIAYLNDAYVMTMGGGREAMEAALNTYHGDANTNMEQYRHGLIAEPNILLLIDLPNLVARGWTIAAEMPDSQVPVDAESLAALKLQPSYIGYSLACEENALRSRTHIPVEQFRGIGQIVPLLYPMF